MMLMKGILTGHLAGWTLATARLPGLKQEYSTTQLMEATSSPASESSSVGDRNSPTGNPPAASGIDEAVRKITLNLGLKTEALAAHGVGIKEALERQHQLHLGMLLAVRRKAVREVAGYREVMIMEALRKSVEKADSDS
ncbi:hypothetical protein Vretimale_5732 [Volvox reticuliferus]|uniref:Uncharacterized protein n=1 Tax=Volvox reticuliferus TaxID=1737510 RepID=A0A8J4FIU2_9CHLO|nr:hypothetical protein Vretifemale_5815 [Volvox reticuliferus]GIM00814.1 hypothetical protein Vretimale_5732 [Volvox reticuliferus]